MRLDHIALRVQDRKKTAEFFIKAFGYRVQTEFNLDFGDGDNDKVKCLALEPPEKQEYPVKIPWVCHNVVYVKPGEGLSMQEYLQEYHMPPEIFVSDGGPDTIVGKWVAARGGIGGIHHLAYQVESVQDKMNEWKERGYAEFTSDAPFTCPGLTQVFTKPSLLTGVIFEFIEREEFGFCAGNVKKLMVSTDNLT
jgi:catechol 2,3-dioxygenase-like lactoylglutathione lyase family enzyme